MSIPPESDSQSPDPYRPPSAELLDVDSEQGRAEATRETHIRHEASVRSVGVLYYLGGLAGLLMGVAMVSAGFDFTSSRDATVIGFGVMSLLFGCGLLFVGYGIRTLKRWSRIPVGILSGIGLLAFPLGTLINVYVLVIVFQKKSRTIFSDDYAQVISKTGHIKYRSSPVVMVALLLIVAAILVAVLLPALT